MAYVVSFIHFECRPGVWMPDAAIKGIIMWNKLERKIGRYAIPRLTNYLIGGYAVGYLFEALSTLLGFSFASYLTLEPYYIIHELQLWRIITWVLIAPQENILFALIMMFFYWQLGTVLEQTWGTFKFNVYIFGGIIFTVIGAFLLYGIYFALNGAPVMIGAYFSTYYINMSIFLAFAMSYPDMQILLYFIIPIKMKWMALVYAVLILFEFVAVGWAGKVAILASLLNFLIFFVTTRNWRSISPGEFKRKRRFRQATGQGSSPFGGNPFGPGPWQSAGTQDVSQNRQPRPKQPVGRHKCAICGRTDVSNPELTFRFCSKCNGNYEYCNDHLFTHTHVQ